DFQIRIACQPSEQGVLAVDLKNTQNLNCPKLGVLLARFRRARSPFRSLFRRRVREQTPGIEIKIAAVLSDELDELKTELFINRLHDMEPLEGKTVVNPTLLR